MAATPPPERPGYGMPNMPMNVARLPIPGNAEFVVYAGATILLAIMALASNRVDSALFVTLYTAITFAYLISRGIAKASRVLEQ